MKTVILLVISNIFMTFAWYGHLRYRSTALWAAVLASWGIASCTFSTMADNRRMFRSGRPNDPVGALRDA